MCRCEIPRVITVEISVVCIVVYYETINPDLKIILISECRWDERLKTEVEDLTCPQTLGSSGNWNT